MADQQFRISGQVVERGTGQGVRGLRVEGWDRDTRYHDMLGVAFTDRRGRFEIRFDSDYFGDFAPDRLPDVYFRVLQHDTLLLSTHNEVMRNLADTDAEVTLTIDLPQPADAPARTNRISGATARKGVAFVRKSDFGGIRADVKDRFSVVRGLAGELLKAKLGSFDLQPLRSSTVRTGAVFNQDVASVQHTLAAREVEVSEVKPYVAASNTQGLLSAALLPERLKAGQKVELFEEGGKVRYFAVVAEPRTTEQVGTLRTDVDTFRVESAEKDRQLAELQAEVKSVREAQAAVSPEALDELKAQLVERDRQITELRTEMASVREALQAEVKRVDEAQTAASASAVKGLESQISALKRQLPK
ncbi:MAG TPA: hypothetical protein VEW03_06050 [Longimicrobiaceae bacterium]|nr:hypothetical protein [Longimicrobiaceae bacterium]